MSEEIIKDDINNDIEEKMTSRTVNRFGGGQKNHMENCLIPFDCSSLYGNRFF